MSKLIISKTVRECYDEAREHLEAAGLMVSDTLDRFKPETASFDFEVKYILYLIASSLEQAVGAASLLESFMENRERSSHDT